MGIERAREHLSRWNRDKDIKEFEASSATVELAAQAVGVEPARIAKTLAFKSPDGAILVVTAGDAKIDNSKFKANFGYKAKLLPAEETLENTGHAVGGVCPFGLTSELPIFLDISMKRFSTIFPACGSSNSAIELTYAELAEYAGSNKWVDVCKGWQE